jgi:uncharacterized membrane-anchored protein
MSDSRMRLIVLFAALLVVLGLANYSIAGKEAVIREGSTVLLRLAPRDPRSLLQGDYMALNYAMTGAVARAAAAAEVTDGVVLVSLDGNAEATFVALYQGGNIQEDQRLLRFRRRGESVRLASDAFFFEEGQFETYRNASFGELRVADDGSAVLTGLRDADGNRLGSGLHQFPDSQ